MKTLNKQSQIFLLNKHKNFVVSYSDNQNFQIKEIPTFLGSREIDLVRVTFTFISLRILKDDDFVSDWLFADTT